MNQNAIVIADTDGVIQLWSAGAAALFGYPTNEAVGRKLDLIVPEQFRGQHWAGFGHAMATASAQAEGAFFDAPVLCSSGETKTFRGQLHVLRNEGKAAIGAMAIFTAPEARQ